MWARTTDTQWRHKSKISEKLGRFGRQNILWPYLKIWDCDWIFGRAVKAISSLGIRSPWLQHGLRTPREKMAFTARPIIQSKSQIFRYGQSIFCLPHQPNFSDIFDLCLHWVSVVRGFGRIYGANLLWQLHRLRTPNEDINQRYLKNWADVADKICCRHT